MARSARTHVVECDRYITGPMTATQAAVLVEELSAPGSPCPARHVARPATDEEARRDRGVSYSAPSSADDYWDGSAP